MKIIRSAILIALSLMVLGVSAEAQRTRRPAKRTPVPKVVKTPAPAFGDLKVAREKVANQIENLSKFRAILGPVGKSIEDFEREAKSKKLSKAAFDANELNKRKVIQAIRNLRAGLAALEVDFRTKAPLSRYLVNIQGITELSARSEDLALAGRFTDAATPLSGIIDKLNTTQTAMK